MNCQGPNATQHLLFHMRRSLLGTSVTVSVFSEQRVFPGLVTSRSQCTQPVLGCILEACLLSKMPMAASSSRLLTQGFRRSPRATSPQRKACFTCRGCCLLREEQDSATQLKVQRSIVPSMRGPDQEGFLNRERVSLCMTESQVCNLLEVSYRLCRHTPKSM